MYYCLFGKRSDHLLFLFIFWRNQNYRFLFWTYAVFTPLAPTHSGEERREMLPQHSYRKPLMVLLSNTPWIRVVRWGNSKKSFSFLSWTIFIFPSSFCEENLESTGIHFSKFFLWRKPGKYSFFQVLSVKKNWKVFIFQVLSVKKTWENSV
jgi:hypothetical protein